MSDARERAKKELLTAFYADTGNRKPDIDKAVDDIIKAAVEEIEKRQKAKRKA